MVIRVIAFIYLEQHGWVKWGDSKSSNMAISNGIRQGAILSPIFWAVYADPLLKLLCDPGLGAVCYADDILLIAPTRSAMQRMLLEMEAFAKESNIVFSTDPVPSKSKTKCISVVGKKSNLVKPSPLRLSGHTLPFVSQADHLGNILTEKGDMEQDVSVKRARFIQSSTEIRELFKWAAPAEIIKATKIHSTAFYGSNLWDLEGEKTKQMYSAWNTTVKLAWGCPQQTRTYFVQQILCCGHRSARVDIMCRYVNFFSSLKRSASWEVQVLARLMSRDIRSVTGRNLLYIYEASCLSPWSNSSKRVGGALVAGEVVQAPPQDEWRVPYLASLLSQRRAAHNLALDLEVERLTLLIDSLVIN